MASTSETPLFASDLAQEFNAARDTILAEYGDFIDNSSQRFILRGCIQEAFQPVLSRVIKRMMETDKAIQDAIEEARKLECNTDSLVDHILTPALLLRKSLDK